MPYSDDMADLRERLARAQRQLMVLRDEAPSYSSGRARLSGKIEGIMLALDYTRAYRVRKEEN